MCCQYNSKPVKESKRNRADQLLNNYSPLALRKKNDAQLAEVCVSMLWWRNVFFLKKRNAPASFNDISTI